MAALLRLLACLGLAALAPRTDACNDHCFTCESSGACTSCKDPAKVLIFGECQYESCTQQYYLDYSTRTCKECDWSCNACKGPLKTDCLLCMEGYALHGGACLERCPLHFYKAAEQCQKCEDYRCLHCSAPNICVQCEAPFYLLETQCVSACNSRYYLDHAKQTCKACPTGCFECTDAQHCLLCDNQTFLKNTLCVTDCGQGFSGNSKHNICEVNAIPPLFHVNGSLSVGIGGVEPLDFSFMNVQDKDTRADSLLFYVVSPPTNGRLVKVLNGKEEYLDVDAHFSWTDLREQRVRFKHSAGMSRNGFFSLKVTDGQFFSQPEAIHIQAVSTKRKNDEPPNISLHPIWMQDRSGVVIRSASLSDEDMDTLENEVVFVVTKLPEHARGHLKK